MREERFHLKQTTDDVPKNSGNLFLQLLFGNEKREHEQALVF